MAERNGVTSVLKKRSLFPELESILQILISFSSQPWAIPTEITRKEVFSGRKMGEIPGKKYFMLEQIPALLIWSLIKRILKYYTLLPGKFIGKPGKCGAVGKVAACINQWTVGIPGLICLRILVCPPLPSGKLASLFLRQILTDSTPLLRQMMVEFIDLMTRAGPGKK